MITGKQKPLEEIQRLIEPYHKVLILGCGTCVTIRYCGGEKEVATLAAVLRLLGKTKNNPRIFVEYTVNRQCEREFLEEITDKIKEVEAILSLACGIGVQAIAEQFPSATALPGINTTFMGRPEELGVLSERCLACGDCIIGLTGGICPITRCAKSLFNGPCGGSVDRKCEVSPDIPCAWQLIYDRMVRLNLLDKLTEIQPPRDWSSSHSGGPRRIVREDLRLPSTS